MRTSDFDPQISSLPPLLSSLLPLRETLLSFPEDGPRNTRDMRKGGGDVEPQMSADQRIATSRSQTRKAKTKPKDGYPTDGKADPRMEEAEESS